MNARMVGADTDALRAAAAELDQEADDLDRSARALAAELGGLQWLGQVAVRFTDNWRSLHQPQLHVTSQFLRENARMLREQADQQDRAARSTGEGSGRPIHPIVGPGGGGTPGGDDGDDGGLLDTLEPIVNGLGLSATLAKELADLLKHVDGDTAKRILSVLGNESFQKALKVAGPVLDLAGAVLDFVGDLGEHPELPWDERIVHAAADMAIQFAVEQGIEAGAGFLGGVIASAIATPAAAPIGTAIGKMGGAVLATVLDATGVTGAIGEFGADLVLDGYRGIKTAVEFGAEAIGAVIDAGEVVVGAVVDGAEVVGGAVVDGAEAIGGAVVDGAEAIGGAVSDGVETIGGWFGL